MLLQFLIFVTMCCTKKESQSGEEKSRDCDTVRGITRLASFHCSRIRAGRLLSSPPPPPPSLPLAPLCREQRGLQAATCSHWRRPVIHSVCEQRNMLEGEGTPTSVPGARCPCQGCVFSPLSDDSMMASSTDGWKPVSAVC